MTLRSKLPPILFLSLTLPCLCFAAEDKEAMFKSLEGEIDAIRARMINGKRLRMPPLPVEGENSFANLKADFDYLRAYVDSRTQDTDAGERGVKRTGPVVGLETLTPDEFKRIQSAIKELRQRIKSIDPIAADFPVRDVPTPDALVEMLNAGHNDIIKYLLVTKQDLKPYEALVKAWLKEGAEGNLSRSTAHALELAQGFGAAKAEEFAPLVGKIAANPKCREAIGAETAIAVLRLYGDAGLEQCRLVLQNHSKELDYIVWTIARSFRHDAQKLVPLYADILTRAGNEKETVGTVLQSLDSISHGIDAAAPAIIAYTSAAHADPKLISRCISLIALGCNDSVKHKDVLLRFIDDPRLANESALMAAVVLLSARTKTRETTNVVISRAKINNGEDLANCVDVFRITPSPPANDFLEKVAAAHESIVFPRDRAPAWEIRKNALLGMVQAGAKFARVRGLIVSFLESNSWSLRAGAVEVFVNARQTDEELLRKIEKLLEDHSAERPNAAEDQRNRERRTLFPLWASVALANNKKDVAKNAMAAWNCYLVERTHKFEPLWALSHLRCTDPTVIDSIKQRLKQTRDRRESENLNALLAVWNVDRESRFEQLKHDVWRSNAVLELFLSLEKESGVALLQDIKRCSSEHHNWMARLVAKVIVAKWEKAND